MADPKDIDGVLVQWGDRLFYPGNRIVKDRRAPRLVANVLRDRAAVIRSRIEATVVRRAPQVMVKVTGGGRGMKAIAAHFRYISKNGRLEMEDEFGNIERGKEAVRGMVEDWRFGGSLIGETSDRREAFNIMLSMPNGTDPLTVLRAARDFAQIELADHNTSWCFTTIRPTRMSTSAFAPSRSKADASTLGRPICIAGATPLPVH